MIYRARVVADDPMREGIHVVIGLPGGEDYPARVVVGIEQVGGVIHEEIPPHTTAPTLFIPSRCDVADLGRVHDACVQAMLDAYQVAGFTDDQAKELAQEALRTEVRKQGGWNP